MKVGVLGAGSMGAGIAQVAATANHKVVLFDANAEMLTKSNENLKKSLQKLVEKEKISQEKSDAIVSNIQLASTITDFSSCDIIIEAIIENLDIKKTVFKQLEAIVSPTCILASNTSSLSMASIASACQDASRVIGIHFFNPATLMPLVEIIPCIQTSNATLETSKSLIDSWGKITVITKDTPGFIVNRVARPFYGEALKIYEEGVADFATIDWAMTTIGGFKMGPFTLMDFIGNDINYTVTETVFAAFYFDSRYKPSLTQKRHAEAGWFGRKSGRGYYNYAEGIELPSPKEDKNLGDKIFYRILYMLINEAAEALFLNIASKEAIDLAMTKGVNYPKGLLAWADELGIQHIVDGLDLMYDEYREDRYRCSPLLRRMAKEGKKFY
jgi:3-hydroxybutyryl-CoA dehydrogenase